MSLEVEEARIDWNGAIVSGLLAPQRDIVVTKH